MADDQENEMNPFGKLESYVAKTTVQNAKFEVEKFDGTNNFGMGQCEVKDVLAQQELDLALEEKPEEMSAADWNRINKMACSTIRLCLAKQQKFNVMRETLAKELWQKLEDKYMTKSAENRLYKKKRLFYFKYKEGTKMIAHLDAFNQLVADLLNLDEEIKDEDKALILLNSLPDSYAHLTTTLLHGKVTIGFEEVSNALMNYEIRHADKQMNASTSDALVVRGRTFERKSHDNRKKFSSRSRGNSKPRRSLGRNECAFCHEIGHWKKDCLKLKNKNKTTQANVTLGEDESGLEFVLAATSNFFSNVWFEKEGVGVVKFKHHDGVIRELKNVWYVPKLGKNLISLGALEADGYNYSSANGRMKVKRGALVEMKALRHSSHLYVLQGHTIIGSASMVSEAVDCDKAVDFEASKLWHLRLGHAGENALQGLAKQGLLKGVKNGKIDFCEQRCWVYTMKHKDEVLSVFLTWKNMIEKQTGRKIKVLRTDNGGEYTSDPFQEVCRKEGIVRHFTVPRTPQQNGVAERLNRTLLEKVRCMLLQASLDKSFWAEAITYASHIVNRLPSTAINGKTPIEVWTGKHAFDYDDLRIFGCIAYFHVTESKLDARAKKAIFVGFSTGVKGYRLWCPKLKKLVLSKDVTFNETSVLKEKNQEADDKSNGRDVQQVECERHKVTNLQQRNLDCQQPVQGRVEEYLNDNEESALSVENEDVQAGDEEVVDPSHSIATGRGKRTIRKPARYTDYVAFAFLIASSEVPLTFKEACESSEKEEWYAAMNEEMDSLLKNQTWTLVRLPARKKAIPSKWVFAKKETPNEEKIRYKARLVAKGYAQKEGVDYNEIFSPVVKHYSIRILLAFVAQFGLELVQLDVKTAFLHGDLNEEIYMVQPDGYKVKGKEDLVCKLQKSLYGLKQSPRQWYLKFDSFMRGVGYLRSDYDHCVYFRKLQDGSFIYLLLYVDDMLIASRSMIEIEKLKAQMKNHFEMKDLGEAKKILGMEITRNKETGAVYLTQKQYLEKLLMRFNVGAGTKSVSTPLAAHFKLSAKSCPKSEEERKDMADVPFANLVGGLMYIMVCSRPDIAQAIGVVSRYMHNPGKDHWAAARWILRYLHGTRDVGLCFQKQECGMKNFVAGYVDSDFAGDLDKTLVQICFFATVLKFIESRSTAGYLFTMAQGPISWRSTLQSTIALSTTDAEYMAATEAIKEALWLQGLISELGIVQNQVELHCDSQSAINLAKHQVLDRKTIVLKKVPTEDNAADMLTKVVAVAKNLAKVEIVELWLYFFVLVVIINSSKWLLINRIAVSSDKTQSFGKNSGSSSLKVEETDIGKVTTKIGKQIERHKQKSERVPSRLTRLKPAKDTTNTETHATSLQVMYACKPPALDKPKSPYAKQSHHN
ncbi:hypothetical protein OSB04_013046 [Centaurea solstitialis]|uniref:Integrase catalytic domain-containing protein n=1 Tax=Centaurea solstitialis TaxID=347529 RepID=A0AA38TVJ5_9ASTR|nr:hypothetical protein OSB04_013046 [Centaurea solstitialis]